MSGISRSTALGAVLGAFIGDSLGSFIEFQTNITKQDLEETLAMRGGGPFRLGEGQVTDDSELAMCMLRGLLDGQGKLNLDDIAGYYGRWVSTGPFDIGATTRSALSSLVSGRHTADLSIQAAIRYNQNSQSNGSLMRMTPMCVWAQNLPENDAAKAARLESSMTHSNVTIQHAAAAYCLAIRHLIRSSGDRQGAFQAAKTYAQSTGESDIQGWFRAIELEEPMPGSPKMGWAKIAFTHAFKHLRTNHGYLEAISDTLAIGGDTDTNAAIVGGLIGAAVGFEGLPPDYVRKVTTYTYDSKGGRRRPEFLDQTSVIEQVERLVAIAPHTTTVIIGGQEEGL